MPKNSKPVDKSRKYHGPHEGFWKYQPYFENIYRNEKVEYFVAALIILNFIVNIWEKQVDPTGFGSDPAARKYAETWDAIGLTFNYLFLIELLVNMYAFWLYDFWADPWNIFDFLVVSIGVIDMTGIDLGPFKLLRLMRAFRVMRLFKRVKSLNKIVVSLGKAVPGMANAMIIQIIFMSIFAMVGVEFFSNAFMPPGSMKGDNVAWTDITTCPRIDKNGIDLSVSRWYKDYENESFYKDTPWTADQGWPDRRRTSSFHDDPDIAPPYHDYAYKSDDYVSGQECYITARGQRYAYEYYGTFFRSLYTLFQVLTGDSWSEAIARPMLERMGGLTSIFYVLYVIINVVVLVNVVVAVLLEKMVDDGSGDDEDDNKPFEHKAHEYANHDAKANAGELFDFKNEMFVKHAILQAQVDALTKNIEALVQAQGLSVQKAGKASVDEEDMYNESGVQMFDEGTGKRLKQPDGKPVLKCWFPPEGSDNNSGQPVQVPADEVVVKRVAGEGKVHPKVHPQMNGDSSESQAKQPKKDGEESQDQRLVLSGTPQESQSEGDEAP